MPERPRRAAVSELEDHLGFWLRFVSNHVSERFRSEVEAAGVTVSQWVALRRLYSGDASPTELTETLGMTKGAVSKLVERLHDRGLITRSAVEGDRRAQRLELTSEGRKLVPRLARLADENDALFFGHLSRKARAQLKELMVEIVRKHQLRDVPVD